MRLILLILFNVPFLISAQKLTKVSFNLTSPLMVNPSSFSSYFEIELKSKKVFEVELNAYLPQNRLSNKSLTQYSVRSLGGISQNFGLKVNYLFLKKGKTDFFVGLGYTKSRFEYFRVTCDELQKNENSSITFCNKWSEKSVINPLNSLNAGVTISRSLTRGKLRIVGRFDSGVGINLTKPYSIRIDDSKELEGTDFKEQNFPKSTAWFNKGITSLDNNTLSFYFLPSILICYEI